MFNRSKKRNVPILMYHSISQSTNPAFKQFTVPPVLFADHMAYLHQHGYTPITVTQLINARTQEEYALPERPVILTFDDGFADFFTKAFPVLQQYGFAATLYVATMFVNRTSRWLHAEGEATRLMITWDQLSEIIAYGIECGAHSHSHRQLDTLPLLVAYDEIMQSKELLEQHLGQEILSFAYPFGYYTKALRCMVREAGYTSACAVKFTMSSEATDRFSLARLMVRADMNREAFAALLTGRNISFATTAYRRVRTPLWQLVRRSSVPLMQYLQERLPMQ